MRREYRQFRLLYPRLRRQNRNTYYLSWVSNYNLDVRILWRYLESLASPNEGRSIWAQFVTENYSPLDMTAQIVHPEAVRVRGLSQYAAAANQFGQ